MDKLRALQYFIAAAEEGSLSGAARRLEVTIPAVAKLVTSLEKSLGTTLFDRHSQGLALTPDGGRYLETCQPLVEELLAADESFGAAASRPRGVVVLGTPTFVSQRCLGPALPQFHARYPDIEVDVRIVNSVPEAEAAGVDVCVLFGWHESPDLVQKEIAQTRYLVLGTPDYWKAHGMPRHPRDLQRHQCLVFRNPRGTLLDMWEFERDNAIESVTVHGWLSSSLRDVVLDAALAGEGVVRTTDLTTRPYLEAGRLVPVLQDWHARNAPPVNVLFRPKHRRTPRVRILVDFATEVFRRLEAERESAVAVSTRPEWYDKRYARASRSKR
jgi:LysR family transcriptional regulator for bpeEF and oprC